MRKIFLLAIFVLIISNVSAILNEVELNPAGADSGNEWVELYSSTEIDLSNYKIVNNDGDEIILSGKFTEYYIYTFEKQWLDNSDEKIYLYKSSDLIEETEILDDSSNNENAWQFCDGSWKFLEATKNLANSCISQENSVADENLQNNSEENTAPPEENSVAEIPTPETSEVKKETSPITFSTIKLNPKDIKRESPLKFSDYAVYGLIGFCMLLAGLFGLKYLKYKKNELV